MQRIVLAQGRRLLMQNALPATVQPGIKRTLHQTSPVLQENPPSSSKVPRVDDAAPLNPPRRGNQGPSGRGGYGQHGSSSRFSKQRQNQGPAHNSRTPANSKRGGKAPNALSKAQLLEGPVHDEEYIKTQFSAPIPLKQAHVVNPKGSLGNLASVAGTGLPRYASKEGVLERSGQRFKVWRTTVVVELGEGESLTAIGDHPEKKASERLAALSAVAQLHSTGQLDAPKKKAAAAPELNEITLSDGSTVNYERARSFMDYYCRRFNFGRPDIVFEEPKGRGAAKWEAVMSVDESRIGVGKGTSKKSAEKQCYLDVVKYLESCDAALWQDFVEAAKSGKDLGMAQKVLLQISEPLDDMVRDICSNIRHTQLYRNRPAKHVAADQTGPTSVAASTQRYVPPRTSQEQLADKSRRLLEERKQYLADPKMEKMRNTRAALPVYTRSNDLMKHIEENEVTICMAATGSGKTTQIPQLILDEYIDRGEGAKCNVICTQPRRLAALSVADRVAKERGQTVGGSIGYQVRFEHKPPQENGSVTFCTTGIFLKRLQNALSGSDPQGTRTMDSVTHVLVDEVHERDVDTDLLLVVLKRLMADRKARGKPIKIVLMSATIDPTLFQTYFPLPNGAPSPTIDIPGRTFPVTKFHLDDFVPKLISGPGRWLLNQDSVTDYLYKELGPAAASSMGVRVQREPKDDLELPFPLIAATISHVLDQSDDGHVLVFLPGWEEITATQRALEQPLGPLAVNVNDRSKYSVHILHSTIPLAEQQVIFEPPAPGIRRVILATNIAETSITIPDVVYVVDTARIKEIRYDPDRHMSSLVSAWVGRSNLNQRAGRAGRHRSGEYFGILGSNHAAALDAHQTVEMKRVDLSNVVMHVKALNFPGMTVEEVLAETIEPPAPERVSAAVKDLQMVGALDQGKNLTSLGRVLLALPVEAQMGRLVLYGSFFRCLDQALTLAAILTNRDPFVCPMHLKKEAQAKKNSWAPEEFRSDALGTLRAFNAWWALQSKGDYVLANRFCVDNFLAKPTLLMIQKIKQHLLQALDNAGVLEISAGGNARRFDRLSVPPELNTNGDSLPLLAGLIAIASQPKFAIRNGSKTLRTANDKTTFIHPSSVNHRKKELPEFEGSSPPDEKQIYAYAEKRRNASTGGPAQTYLITTTKLDPMTYMLFGAYDLAVAERGLVCDGWLPIVGYVDALDNIQRLKTYMEASMLRVFEGISMGRRHLRPHNAAVAPREEEDEDLDETMDRDYSLSAQEVKELDLITRDIVEILERASEERMTTQSNSNSRPVTPMDSPLRLSTRLPGGIQTGYNTPYTSRPGTPSRLGPRRPF